MKFLPKLFSKTIFAFMIFCFVRAEAHIYIVTNTNDSTRISSLRGAIMASNKNAEFRAGRFNLIVLQAKTYQLSISGADENLARRGDLDITRGHLMIIVPNGTATINATGLGDRIFQINSNTSLTLSDVILTGGTAPRAEYGEFTTLKEAGGRFTTLAI